MKKILVILFISTAINCLGQVNIFSVAPDLTNPNYEASQDNHFIATNISISSDKLFLSLGGTRSVPKSYRALCKFTAELGNDVVSLSYENSVAAASLAYNSDSLAFQKYRQKICYGGPLSVAVDVDSLNSIYSRTINLIQYLHLTFPDQNWKQYLVNSNSLNWSKIIIAGHSQGSGHAFYFAKFNLLDRVIMFSGPNDYSDFFSASAPWLGNPGITSIEKHFSYLSLSDEIVDFEKQLEISKA